MRYRACTGRALLMACGLLLLSDVSAREAGLTDVPYSVSALSGEDIGSLGAIDTELINAVPRLTVQNLPSEVSRALYVRGLPGPAGPGLMEIDGSYYPDPVALNETVGTMIDRVNVLRGPSASLYGRSAVSGALSDWSTSDRDPCTPQNRLITLNRALQLERGLASTTAFNLKIDYALGRAGFLTDFDYELSEANRRLLENAQHNGAAAEQGLQSQYDALRTFAAPVLNDTCPPLDVDAFQGVEVPALVDGLFGARWSAWGTALPNDPRDAGSRWATPVQTTYTGAGEVLGADLKWRAAARFDWPLNDYLSLRAGAVPAPCDRRPVDEGDVSSFAFGTYAAWRNRKGIGLDLQSYDFKSPSLRNWGWRNDAAIPTADQGFINGIARHARAGACLEPERLTIDPTRLRLSYDLKHATFGDGFIGEPETPRINFDLNGLNRVLLQSSLSDRFDYPRVGSLGSQLGFDDDPLQFTSGTTSSAGVRYDFRQSLPYQPAHAYTLRNPFSNDLMMPSCFMPRYYGTIKVGDNRYVRVFIDPAVILGLQMRGLEVLGVRYDEVRGQLTAGDPYFSAPAAGGGAWGQSYADQWAIQRVGFDRTTRSAWASVGDGEPVVVAIVDSGLDWHHADIDPASIWHNTGEVPDNGRDDDNNGYVDDVIGYDFMERHGKPWDFGGHGTIVAGIIAAAQDNGVGIAGVNPNVRLMVLRVLNAVGKTRASYIAEAITYAVDNGADIVNVSIGGEGLNPLEAEAVDYAEAHGVVVVAAAGNEGGSTDEYSPAGLERVLTVGASDLSDAPATFSNTGAAVDLVAPGIDVLSLRARGTDANLGASGDAYTLGAYYVGDDHRYIRASGTSFAAPIVTGTASLVLAQTPTLTPAELRERLTATAWDVGPPGRDDTSGHGLLDARAAMNAESGFYVSAEITAINPDPEANTIAIVGTADASRFKRAWLQIGSGASPVRWKYVGLKLKKPVVDAVLSEIPLDEFSDTGVWTVMVTAEHKNGTVRRAVRTIKLR